nr:hypothetical protein [Tanacetum cinerariifolium]
MTRNSNTKIFTPFANLERKFRAMKDTKPILVHNIYSFYESEQSDAESEEMGKLILRILQWRNTWLSIVGVVIRYPKETATPSTIIHSEAKSKDKGKWILVEEPKPFKKQAQIEQDEAYARELEAELNKNIVPEDFGEPEGLEEFLMNDEINEDLRDFLEENDILSRIDLDSFEVLPDSDREIRIRLEDLGEGIENFWDA